MNINGSIGKSQNHGRVKRQTRLDNKSQRKTEVESPGPADDLKTLGDDLDRFRRCKEQFKVVPRGLEHPQVKVPKELKKVPVPLSQDPRYIPSLREAFELGSRFPDKKIYLDTKTPDDPQIGRRLAGQIMEQLREKPELKDRVVVMNPNDKVLDAMKDEFGKAPDFKDFKNFALDNENLNKLSPSAEERSPLTESGDNRYVSIGNPKSPFTPNGIDDLTTEIRKADLQTQDKSSPHYGKKILAWTLNEPEQIESVVKAGADGVLTDNPEMMSRTLDKMGYGKDDPNRPEVISHRGGPNNERNAENTLPRMEEGYRSKADGIEIDIVSAKDGVVVYHDRNPMGVVEMLRNIGAESDNKWRPTFPGLWSNIRQKPMEELTISEIRENYGYDRNGGK